jgi:DNA uptake protein ComE-like DNA-binding protein
MRRVISIALISVAIALGAACTVHTDSKSREEAEQAKQEAKDAAREAADEAKQAGREAAAEGKAAADEAKQAADDARREGDDARREAHQQADDARREAADARREAMDSAKADGDRDHDNDHDTSGGPSGDVVNLNTANAKDIADATGLTTNLAQKIVAGRPYVSKRDLVSKKIVDEQTYWKIQKNVTVMSK